MKLSLTDYNKSIEEMQAPQPNERAAIRSEILALCAEGVAEHIYTLQPAMAGWRLDNTWIKFMQCLAYMTVLTPQFNPSLNHQRPDMMELINEWSGKSAVGIAGTEFVGVIYALAFPHLAKEYLADNNFASDMIKDLESLSNANARLHRLFMYKFLHPELSAPEVQLSDLQETWNYVVGTISTNPIMAISSMLHMKFLAPTEFNQFPVEQLNWEPMFRSLNSNVNASNWEFVFNYYFLLTLIFRDWDVVDYRVEFKEAEYSPIGVNDLPNILAL